MTQYNPSGTKTFPTNEAIAQHLLMTLSAGKWRICGAGETPLATNITGYVGSGSPATGLLFNVAGTRNGIAADTFSAGDILYAASGGKVSGALGGRPVGIALENGVANQVVEYIGDLNIDPLRDIAASPLAAAGDSQANAPQLVSAVTRVSGADGSVGVRLPPATPGAVVVVFNEHSSSGLKIYPASGAAINGASANAPIVLEGLSVATFNAIDGTNWLAMYEPNA